MGMSIGGFAGGLSQGLNTGMKLRDRIDARADAKSKKAQEDEIKKAGTSMFDSFDEPIVAKGVGDSNAPTTAPAQDSFGLNQFADTQYVDPQNEQTQVGQAYKNGGLVVRKYADGGLIENPIMAQDSKSLVGQTAQNMPQPASVGLETQQPKVNPGKRLSASYNAMRDKAMELGRPDLAEQYQNIGFKVRDRMVTEGLKGAQRAYQMTGDIKGFVDVYNDALDDDANIDGYEKTENGYKLKVNDGGNIIEREVGKSELEGMIMQFSDPAARWAMERESLAKRNEAIFKTDEEIRKSKETEGAKLHNVPQGGVMIDGQGKPLYSNPKAPTKERGETDIEFYQRDPDGYAQFKEKGSRGGKSSSGSNGDAEIKKSFRDEIKSSIDGYEGMAEVDSLGQSKPTKAGREANIFGQRLAAANSSLQPADIGRLAKEAATNPKALDFEVVEREDGTRYKRQVVLYQGQKYQLGTTAPVDIPAPANPKAEMKPRPVQSAPVQAQPEPVQEEQDLRKPVGIQPKLTAKQKFDLQQANDEARRAKKSEAREREQQAERDANAKRKQKQEQRRNEITAFNNANRN